MAKIRKAMERENNAAAEMAANLGPVATKPVFNGIKQGPISVADRKPSSSVLQRAQQEDDYIPVELNTKPTYLQRNPNPPAGVVLPASNVTKFGQPQVKQPLPTLNNANINFQQKTLPTLNNINQQQQPAPAPYQY